MCFHINLTDAHILKPGDVSEKSKVFLVDPDSGMCRDPGWAVVPAGDGNLQ